MKANTQVTIGNFAVDIEADADAQMLANLGLRWIVQRQTTIDKTLGAFFKGADGKEKRKSGWKRTDVEFTPAMAEKLQTVLESLALPDSEDKLAALPNVTEYVREAPEKKFVDAKAAMARHESANDIEAWLAGLGYTGPTHGEDGEYAVEALRIVDAKIAEMLRAARAAV